MPAPPSHRGALGRLLAACAIVFACFAGGVVAVGANELHATARVLEAQPRIDLGGQVTSTTRRADQRQGADDPADRLRPSRHGRPSATRARTR